MKTGRFENHTNEVHAFHLHQLHFVVLAINGVPTNDSAVRDTVVIPYWDGKSQSYPSVKVRVDFRDPETVGTFLYHCHILDHEDLGMMAKIQVKLGNCDSLSKNCLPGFLHVKMPEKPHALLQVSAVVLSGAKPNGFLAVAVREH